MQKIGFGILCFHTAGLINRWSRDHSTLSNFMQWIYCWEAKSQTLKKRLPFMESESSLRCSQKANASGPVKHFLIYCCFALCACQSVVVKLKGPPLLIAASVMQNYCSYQTYLIAVSLVSRVHFFKSHHNESQIECADLSVTCDLWHKYGFYFQNRWNQAAFLSFDRWTKTKFSREISYRSTETQNHQN